jgi:predicted RNA-binding Zn-ribbon protein involved in translation (DUF1610 family)
MSRLGREFAVAPRAGVAVSAALAVVGAVAFFFVAKGFPPPARLLFSACLALFSFVYGFLVCYVWGDAKRRGMRHRIWALVAALVPNALGFLAYFLLREPVLRRCASCGTAVRRDLAFCPQCGTGLALACPSCRRLIEPGWGHCAHCGAKLSAEPA